MSHRVRRPKGRHARTLTLVFLCGLLAGSMPSVRALAVGEPCPGGETECPEDEVCVDAVCQAAEPCSGWDCLPDTPCGSDAECASFEDCVDGVCVIALLPECGDVVECPAGETCVSGHCVASPDGSAASPTLSRRRHLRRGVCEPGEPTGCRSDGECRRAPLRGRSLRPSNLRPRVAHATRPARSARRARAR
jgi:hypothetical protein